MAIITKVLTTENGNIKAVDLTLDTLQVSGLNIGAVPLSQVEVASSFSGIIPSTATLVVLTANNAGTAGNSISLTFTGSNSIDTAIATWNAANTSNQVSLTSGNGSQIPSAQSTATVGGVDAGTSLIGNTANYLNFTPTSADLTGVLRGIDAALAASSGGAQKVDTFTLDGTDEANKFVTLAFSPTTPGDTILLVHNAPNMYYGADFTVSGSQLSWSSLALDGILASGDQITVIYSV